MFDVFDLIFSIHFEMTFIQVANKTTESRSLKHWASYWECSSTCSSQPRCWCWVQDWGNTLQVSFVPGGGASSIVTMNDLIACLPLLYLNCSQNIEVLNSQYGLLLHPTRRRHMHLMMAMVSRREKLARQVCHVCTSLPFMLIVTTKSCHSLLSNSNSHYSSAASITSSPTQAKSSASSACRWIGGIGIVQNGQGIRWWNRWRSFSIQKEMKTTRSH